RSARCSRARRSRRACRGISRSPASTVWRGPSGSSPWRASSSGGGASRGARLPPPRVAVVGPVRRRPPRVPGAVPPPPRPRAPRRTRADLGACTARFLDPLAHERRASPHTVAASRRDLEGLCAFATERLGRPSRLGDVDRLLLRAYLSQLAESRGAATLGRKLASLRTFFRYLEQNAVTRDNPAAALASPKIRRRLPRVLDAETAAEVMDAPRTRDDGAESARDAA